jgi:dipeptidyl aminopeptidase/acylaminoacyl peptidase
VSDISGVPQVWVLDAHGGWPERVTAIEDPVQAVAWSPRGDWLGFQFAPGGGMNAQIGVVRPDGTGLRVLTDRGPAGNRVTGWMPDGSALLIASNRRRVDVIDALLLDPESADLRLVAEGRPNCTLCHVSRDGRLGLLQRDHNRTNNDVYLLDLKNGNEKLLTSHEGFGTFGQPQFACDGRRVFILSNAESEYHGLDCVELKDDGQVSELKPLLARDDAELEIFELSPDGKTALLVWNVAGKSEADVIDIDTLVVETALDLPGEVLMPRNGVSWSGDSRRLALAVTGSKTPLDIWTFDQQLPSLTQVTRSAHAGVVLTELAEPELIQFRAHDGLPLSGWAYRAPDRPGPARVVLSFHGGPEGQARPNFNALYQSLTQLGISVFAPNVRGSSGFGKSFVNLDNGELRFDAIRDISACVNAAVDAKLGTPGHIGIAGGSYGGYMTMAGLAWYPNLFAAGANLFGIVNFATFFTHTERWMAEISKLTYGDPEAQAELLRDLSPLTHIDNVVAPTLVLHGANDTNVPVVEAEQVIDALRSRGISCEYVLYPDEGHGFVKEANRIDSNTAIARWFQHYLSCPHASHSAGSGSSPLP